MSTVLYALVAALVLAPFLLAPMFDSRYPCRVRAHISAAALIGFLFLLAPWTLRNALVFGEFLPVNDAAGKPILKTFLEDDGETLFSLAGFPVVLSKGCPGTDGVSKRVAAFGTGSAYAVMLRREFQFEASRFHRWNTLQTAFRSIGRVRGEMKRGASFAILQTAAV